jgi:phage tail-like protein
MSYPPVGFHFRVDFALDGVEDIDMRFQEVSGLSAEIGVEEYPEGGENRFTHRLPTRGKYPNLVLRRGLATDSRLIEWVRDATQSFVFQPCDVTVVLLNPEHEPLATWSFQNAWPVKWSASDLRALENAIVVETLELAYRMSRRI